MPGNENGEGVFAERKRSAFQVKCMTHSEAQSRSHRTWLWQASKRAKNMKSVFLINYCWNQVKTHSHTCLAIMLTVWDDALCDLFTSAIWASLKHGGLDLKAEYWQRERERERIDSITFLGWSLRSSVVSPILVNSFYSISISSGK